MANLNSFVADELSYKVNKLYSALDQANCIIDTLKIENQRLYDALNSLASENKQGYEHTIKGFDEQYITV